MKINTRPDNIIYIHGSLSDQAKENLAVGTRRWSAWLFDECVCQKAFSVLVQRLAQFTVFDDQAQAFDVQPVVRRVYEHMRVIV